MLADRCRVREIGASMLRLPLLFVVFWLVACEPDPPARAPAQYYPPPGSPGQPGPPAPAPALGNLPERRPEDISRVVNQHTAAFSDCYQRSESFMTGKSGKVTLFFEIAAEGRVLGASDAAPPGISPPGPVLVDAKLVECLSRNMLGLRFDPARDSTRASWTFPFSP